MSGWEDAWSEIERRWLPDDLVRPSPQYAAQYRTKWQAAQGARPRVIAEIGVRAGYSALAMLLAAPQARFLGFERDAGDFGGEQGLTSRALPRVLDGFDWKVEYVDSQAIARLVPEVCLFHIDGDHSYDGTWHDLELAWPVSRFVLVDDYDYIRSVQAAVDHWIVTHRLAHPAVQPLTDGGFRGGMLLAGALHPAMIRRTI